MIRQATLTDLPECSRLIQKIVQEEISSHYPSGVIDAWLEYVTPERLETEMSTTNFIVYEDGDKILGVGAIKGSHIKKVYTRFGYRDSGIGTDLTTQLEQIARRNGHDKCSVHSTQNAVGFYAKLGYQSQREIPLEPVELGETLIEMVKQI